MEDDLKSYGDKMVEQAVENINRRALEKQKEAEERAKKQTENPKD